MDIKEASAMTEASGLVDEQDGRRPSAPTSDGQRQMHARPHAAPLSDQLRTMATNAPLRSLLVAFIAGVWIGRRL